MRASALFVLALWTAAPARAALEDIGRITMGRTTFPRHAWVLDLFEDEVVPRWAIPVGHTLSQRVVAAYGVTDRLSVGLIETTLHAERSTLNTLKADEWGGFAGYRVLDEPFEFTPLLVALPVAPNKKAAFVVGGDLLKNVGNWTFHLGYIDEFEQGEGETAYGGNHHIVEPGVFCRFGLHGLVGVHYMYQTFPAMVSTIPTPFGSIPVTTPAGDIQMWGPVLGGSISKNLFLGLEQRFGMTRQSPAYMTTLQFQIYFGPYALGSWGL